MDVVIRNAKVIDGTGNPWYWADVGLTSGRIETIQRRLPDDIDAETVVDAQGQVVSPGFIDPHSHAELNFLIDNHAASKIMQGVTTEITGNCGGSPVAPLRGIVREEAEQRVRASGVEVDLDWQDLAGYFDRLDARGAVNNQGLLAGHGTIRAAVMGTADRKPTADELEQMKSLLAQYLDDGAVGMSTGLYYAPGFFADTDEVVALAEVVAQHGKLYTSHIRDQSEYNIGHYAAYRETIEIGRRAGCPVVISHMKCIGPPSWGRAPYLLEMVDRARGEGIDIVGEQYPYTYTGGSIAGALLPRWVQTGSHADAVQLMQDPDKHGRVADEIATNLYRRGGADRVVVSAYRPDTSLEGRSLGDIAAERGVSPVQLVFDMFEVADAGLVTFSLQERDLLEFQRYPHVMIGSDGNALAVEGPLSKGHPHPRSFGTFPRALRKFAREEKLYSLEEGVRRMTSFPARMLGLNDRGVLREGAVADVIIWDPTSFTDVATPDEPKQYASGLDWAFVAGTAVVANGKLTGETPGRALRL